MRRFFWIFGLLALVFWGVGALRARASSSWTRLESDLSTRVFYWQGVKVRAFRAPASQIGVGTGRYLEAYQWLNQEKARVAVNGGYFDGKGTAMGLRVSRGKLISPLRSADWGVFWVSRGVAHIAHTRDFSSKIQPREAMQCGPRLVVDGQPTDLKPQWDRRTGIGIDRSGRVVLAVSDGQLSLDEWAKMFAADDGLGCRDALNLDGGGSTQIAFNATGLKGKLRGSWPVPDVMLIR